MMTRKILVSQLVTVQYGSAFTAFVPVTTLADTIFNFNKNKKLKRIYPICSEQLAEFTGRLRFLDTEGNDLQVVPVTSGDSTALPPTVRVSTNCDVLEFTNLEIGGFSLPSIACNVSSGGLTFELTFEFENEMIEYV